MKKSTLFLIIFLATGFVMFLTNPNEQKHKDAVSVNIIEALSEQRQEMQERNNHLGGLVDNLNDYMIGMIVTPIVKNNVSREDYVVFSLTRLNIPNNAHRIGIGIFGKVFIAPQLKTSIKKYINDATAQKLAD